MAAYTQHVIDEAMSDIIHAADPTLALGALSVQSQWAAFDLRVCRGGHPDEPDKGRLRNEEVEYFRAAVAGMPDLVFGRLAASNSPRIPREGRTGRTPIISTDPATLRSSAFAHHPRKSTS